MKFNFLISKNANFYFFVQNLSEWHFSARKEYNKVWKEELGIFSEKEKRLLHQFAKIHKKYSFGKRCLGQYFFGENPWEKAEEKISSKHFNKIKETFDILRKKFETVYKKDKVKLDKWRKKLVKEVEKKETEEILEILSTLYNINPTEDVLDVYLLLSAGEKVGGGANLEKKNITIELSQAPLDNTNRILGVMWHEIIHLLFEKPTFISLIKNIVSSSLDTNLPINEIAASSLFPRGILGIRLLKNNPPSKLYKQVNKTQTIELIDLMKEYVDKKRPLDLLYIQKVKSILKQS